MASSVSGVYELKNVLHREGVDSELQKGMQTITKIASASIEDNAPIHALPDLGMTDLTLLNLNVVPGKETPKRYCTSPLALLIGGVVFGIFGGGMATGTTYLFTNTISWSIMAGVAGFILFTSIPYCAEMRHQEMYKGEKHFA